VQKGKNDDLNIKINDFSKTNSKNNSNNLSLSPKSKLEGKKISLSRTLSSPRKKIVDEKEENTNNKLSQSISSSSSSDLSLLE